MAEILKSFFTDSSRPRVLFSHEPWAKGGIGTYLPFDGEVAIRSDVYEPKHFVHPFFDYIRAAFGDPRIQLLREVDLALYASQNPRVLAMHHTPEIVQEERRLGIKVNDVYNVLNNKEHFQAIVRKELGAEHSTKPDVAEVAMTVDDVIEIASSKRTADNSRVVLRVPDINIAASGGVVGYASSIMKQIL